MKKFIAVIALAASLPFLAAPAQADEQADILAAATAYVDSPTMQGAIDAMIAPEGMVQQIKTMMPGLSAQTLLVVSQIVGEEMTAIRPAMRQAMIDSAASVYTLEEINALNDFIRTPHGASAIAKAQTIFTTSMEALAPEFLAAQQRIGQRFTTYVQQQKTMKSQQRTPPPSE